MTSHDDRIHPHPALRAGLSLPGRAVFSLPCNCMCKPSLRRTKPRRLLSLALARARERMKGEGVGRTSMHDDRIDPHPALRAGLSLPGRGVSLLLRWEQATAFASGVWWNPASCATMRAC